MSCSVRNSICSPTGQAYYAYTNTIHGTKDFTGARIRGSQGRKYVSCKSRCVPSKSLAACAR